MPTPIRIKEEMNVLKMDADKIVKDISKLTSELSDAGMDQGREVSAHRAQSAANAISQLRRKAAENTKLVGNYAAKADTKVRQNPYPFIGASIGIGWLISRLLRTRHQ